MVEWYQPGLATGFIDAAIERLGLAAAGSRVRILMTLTSPSDETVFLVLAADCAEDVITVCRLAGWQTDRVTAGVQARVAAALG